MTSLVFYFSGTGNSLSVAKALSGETQPVNIVTAERAAYIADRIGFVYPSYCGEAPAPVKDFISSSSFRAEYLWAVVTSGGSPGNALASADAILRKQGTVLHFGKTITLPDNVILYKDAENLKKRLLETENERVAAIRADIEMQKTNTVSFSKSGKLITGLSWFGLSYLFFAGCKRATDHCFGCTQCEKLCPAGNIKMKNGKAVFGKTCYSCFGCIQFCPNNAIRFGLIRRTKSSQYTHPGVSAKEMIRLNKKLGQ